MPKDNAKLKQLLEKIKKEKERLEKAEKEQKKREEQYLLCLGAVGKDKSVGL